MKPFKTASLLLFVSLFSLTAHAEKCDSKLLEGGWVAVIADPSNAGDETTRIWAFDKGHLTTHVDMHDNFGSYWLQVSEYSTTLDEATCTLHLQPIVTHIDARVYGDPDRAYEHQTIQGGSVDQKRLKLSADALTVIDLNQTETHFERAKE